MNRKNEKINNFFDEQIGLCFTREKEKNTVNLNKHSFNTERDEKIEV